MTSGGLQYQYITTANATGNLKFKAATGDEQSLLYFELDDVSVELVVDENTTFKYDFAGRRVSKTVTPVYWSGSANTTKYCYAGDQVIAEYDTNDVLKRKFIYGPGIDEPICMIDVADSNAIYYYHFDGLGSVIALSDNQGDIVEKYSYDVFGKPMIKNTDGVWLGKSSKGNPYLFTGRRYDADSGLYYYRARNYDPYIGRFLQTDPIRYAAGLNLYTYVGNNPVNWIDPYGLWNFRIGGGFGLAFQLNFGRNSGQWSLSTNFGLGAGAIVSFDSTDTGAGMAGRGGGVNAAANASGQLWQVGGANIDFAAHGTLGSRGVSSGGDFSVGGAVGPIGVTGHAVGELGSGGATGDVRVGKTAGLGAMGFVGAGGHVTWGDGDEKGSGSFRGTGATGSW